MRDENTRAVITIWHYDECTRNAGCRLRYVTRREMAHWLRLARDDDMKMLPEHCHIRQMAPLSRSASSGYQLALLSHHATFAGESYGAALLCLTGATGAS